MAPLQPRPFVRRDAIGLATKGTLVIGGGGMFLSAVQNALMKQNVGVWGVMRKIGGATGTYAAMGGSYMFFRNAAANLRETDDFWNSTIGGFIAGGILGTKFRTMPAVIGYGAGLALILSVFDYTGGSLTGFLKDINVDEVERKEMIRTGRRRPLKETLDAIGEGRGIFPAGYEDRRRARLTERYGVDFTNVERR